MKCLLAYLFIVFGFGLFFNANADLKPIDLFKASKNFNKIYQSNSELIKAYKNVPPLCEKWGMGMIINTGEVVEAVHKIISNPNKKLNEFNFNFSNNCASKKLVTANYKGELKQLSMKYLKSVWKAPVNNKEKPTTGFIINTIDYKYEPDNPSTSNEFSTLGHQIILYRLAGFEVSEILQNKNFRNFNNYYNKTKTQIAKAEPNLKPVKVAKIEDSTKEISIHEKTLISPNSKLFFVGEKKHDGNFYFLETMMLYSEHALQRSDYIFDNKTKLFTINGIDKIKMYRVSEKMNKNILKQRWGEDRLKFFKSYNHNEILNGLIEEFRYKTNRYVSLQDLEKSWSDDQVQIAGKQPKFKPLREALEEKYGDPKSEETKVTAKPKKKFQPKETISDDESPIIDIASVITVNDQAYTLKGKIKDKSAVYLTVDGRAVDLNKDEFEIERFSVNPDQQQKIKIVAIDEWNNKSEKTVTVKIDLSQNKVAKKYEDLKPNNIRRVKTDNNRIAIIIGIEKYQYLNNLDAKYANRDANAFRAYATRALGIPSSNVEVLVDDKATRTQILKTFKNNLRRLAGKKGKEIHIFFAGHGLASDNGEDLYILPQDGESSLLEDTAISRVELIELIQQVNPNSVTMYFDTCYSGQTRDEQLLVASLRPVRIVADEQETPDNFTIFTASDYDQTSGSIEEAKHGMFSYYLMKGLEGNADLNTDNKITNGELISYLKDNVSQEAFIQNRQQDPMFSGDPDKVLISYN
jgi:hypothetical protein